MQKMKKRMLALKREEESVCAEKLGSEKVAGLKKMIRKS